ncbi:CopK family periplasmic copper-binding protein [Cupriavidus necator]
MALAEPLHAARTIPIIYLDRLSIKSRAYAHGSTVHVFKDGKMAVENPFDRAVNVKEGQVLEAKDGIRITMKGNEVMRLDSALNADRRGG